MSSAFSRLNVLTQSQHDAKCRAPTKFIRPATPDYLRINTKDTSGDDPEMVHPCSRTKPSANNSNWLTRLSTKTMALTKLCEKAMALEAAELDKETKIKIGSFVRTRNRAIAPLSKHARNKRKVREEVFGTVVARSAFQPRFWLVKFKNNKTLYCTDKVLMFVSNTSPTHELKGDENNNLNMNNVDMIIVNQEEIMRVLLCSKIHVIPGHPRITYRTLVALFKPQFSWLTVGKLKYHAKKNEREN